MPDAWHLDCETQVAQPDFKLLVDHDVFGLDIPVNRVLMGILQRHAQVFRDTQDFHRRHPLPWRQPLHLVAQALHNLSPAHTGRFVTCNCSAVVETLFESELFGYVKGAFTGATSDKMGLVEFAHGGTLFLDEIGDMPLATQAKLLRTLQNQEVTRVGSVTPRKVDVRVVAATNRDVETLISQKLFREDLYYRLAMVELRTPPLAERKEDLPLLEKFFLTRFCEQFGKDIKGLTRRAQISLAKHPWPGNVRELENALGHAAMMAMGVLVVASAGAIVGLISASKQFRLGQNNSHGTLLAERTLQRVRLAKKQGLYDAAKFSPEAWTQFLGGQSPFAQNFMSSYMEQSKSLVAQMQEQMAKSASALFPGMPGFAPAKDKSSDKS